VPAKDPEIDRALDAMTAPELRAAVRAVLDELDEDVKASIVDMLIGRATKASSDGGPHLHLSGSWRRPGRSWTRRVTSATQILTT
jgi:hypothetical protein